MSNKEVSKAIYVMLAVGLFTVLFTFLSLHNGEKSIPVVQNSSGTENSTDCDDRESKETNESFHQNIWWGQLVKVPIERGRSLTTTNKGHLDEDYYNCTNPNNA